MNNKCNVQKKYRWLLACVILTIAPICHAWSPSDNKVFRYYKVDIKLFSIDPTEPFESYRCHGDGSAGAGGTVGLGCYDSGRNFMVNTLVRKGGQRFLVNVGIVPDKKDKKTEQKSYDIDLTNLKPQSLELAKLDDGRLCMLTLTPSVEIVDNRPKQADASAFQLDRWSLIDSIVVFNDSVYAGHLGCAGGPLAYVSYPGYAKVVFALVPFADAEPIGILKDGRIQIRSEGGQMLDIYGVKNGIYEMELPGGPYKVWARWEDLPVAEEFKIPPKEEWIRMVKAQFAVMGNTPPGDDELDAGYEKAKNQKHVSLSSGVGGLNSKF